VKIVNYNIILKLAKLLIYRGVDRF
jgi:hypothetical protein